MDLQPIGDLGSSSFTKTPASATSTVFSLSSAASNLKYLRVARNTIKYDHICTSCIRHRTSWWDSFVNFVADVLPLLKGNLHLYADIGIFLAARSYAQIVPSCSKQHPASLKFQEGVTHASPSY